ncbi:beta-glucanase [Immersiella caudata]|uniref:Beta-glucanase n=1 Tax=Immersiella caudata TaxID=314043 RepID=A0AA39WC37_9PEZI|nr:beta-glucanase [Immersiella caudata]
MYRPYKEKAPWYDVRSWTRWTWAGVIAAIIIIVAIAIAVPVAIGSKRDSEGRYPDYLKLNYTLLETYGTDRFFDKFHYRNGPDPTNGHVHYVDPDYAATFNLTPTLTDSVILRVDTSVGPSSTPDASTGRFSVRLESKRQYNQGLFLFDVKHSPFGCATWPALWLVDPTHWPDHGEIDIMEAVLPGAPSFPDLGNSAVLHTSPSCRMDGKRNMTGAIANVFGSNTPTTDCDSRLHNNAGCGVSSGAETFGPAFSAAGGGITAVEWRNEGIRIWQFPRAAIPADIQSGAPDPSIWPIPLADFPNTNCDIGARFRNASIVANIALCGDAMPEKVWSASGCPTPCAGKNKCVGGWTKTNCTDFVANNPKAFENAYWEFGEFRVYQAE